MKVILEIVSHNSNTTCDHCYSVLYIILGTYFSPYLNYKILEKNYPI